MLLAHRATGYVPRTFRYPFEGVVTPQVEAAARVSFFDAVVGRYAPDVDQFVILGAGFDTRAFRLPDDVGVRSFEVDTLKTQSAKRAILERTGIDATKVTFVSGDFEKEDWLTRLVAAGFDAGKPTLFLLEGVVMYLTTEPLESRALFWRLARAGTTAGGEPLKFGVDSTPPSRERLVDLLRSCGLALAQERTLGQETEGKRAWGGFAIAIVS